MQSQFLVDCGLVIKHSKQCFEKALWKHKIAYDDIFTYHPVKETGLKDFYKVFRCSVRYPERTYENFVKAVDTYVNYYNSGGTIDNFQTVYLNSKPAGILMPYKIFSTYPPKFKKRRAYGTLLQIAVVREFRGKGYGRIIHSHGLMQIKDMGLNHYLGSTETRNHAMIRVFKLNKCRQTLTQNFYSL